MPLKLTTTISKISQVSNPANAAVIKEFHNYQKSKGLSENHQNNCLKAIIGYAQFIGPKTSFYDIQRREQMTSFLDTKIKDVQEDPEKKWITTWNYYLLRLRISSDGCITSK